MKAVTHQRNALTPHRAGELSTSKYATIRQASNAVLEQQNQKNPHSSFLTVSGLSLTFGGLASLALLATIGMSWWTGVALVATGALLYTTIVLGKKSNAVEKSHLAAFKQAEKDLQETVADYIYTNYNVSYATVRMVYMDDFYRRRSSNGNIREFYVSVMLPGESRIVDTSMNYIYDRDVILNRSDSYYPDLQVREGSPLERFINGKIDSTS